MLKPFNPILGETFQATIGDFNLNMEQISHHPPVSSFMIESAKHPDFKSYGNLESVAYTSMNSVKATIKGSFVFEFGKEEKIEMFPNSCKIGSLMSSTKRTYKYTDVIVFRDDKNGIFCFIYFDPDEKSGFKSLFKSKETPSDTIEGVITTDENLDYKSIWKDEEKVKQLREKGVILH